MCAEQDDRREFLRVDYETPFNFKQLKGERLSNKYEALTKNVSACGLLIRVNDQSAIPALSSLIWVELDQKMMNICAEIESDLIVHNSGIFGRVVRISEGEPGLSYDVGICFLRRKHMTDAEIEDLMKD